MSITSNIANVATALTNGATITNLNAQLLNGQTGTYYTDQSNSKILVANTQLKSYVDGQISYLLTIDNTQNNSIQVVWNTANTGNNFINTGGVVTGNVTISNDLTIQGNLTVLGISTTINTSSLDIKDSLIYLANGNFTSDAIDIGIIGHYYDGIERHGGIIRDPNLKEWIFFQNYQPEVQANNLINIADPTFAYSNVYANYFKGNVIGNLISTTGGIKFPDNTTQTTAGASTGKAIAMSIVFGG